MVVKKRSNHKVNAALVASVFVIVLILAGVANLEFTGHASAIVPSPTSDFGQTVVSLMNNVVSTINPIARYVLGETEDMSIAGTTVQAPTVLFVKIIFFIFLLSMVYLVLKELPFLNNKNDWVLWVLSIGFPILVVRFLSNTLIKTILMPYTAVGAAFLTFLPFIGAFIFIENGLAGKPTTLRRIAWILLAIVFVGMWVSFGFKLEGWGWLYPIFAVASFIMMKMDGTYQKIRLDMAMEKSHSITKAGAYNVILDALESVEKDWAEKGTSYRPHHSPAGTSGKTAYHADVKELNDRLDELRKRK